MDMKIFLNILLVIFFGLWIIWIRIVYSQKKKNFFVLSVIFFKFSVSDNNLNGYIEEFLVLDIIGRYLQICVKNNK